MLWKCFWLSLTYAIWYVVSHAVLLREHTLNLQFLLTLVWAFPMTLMIASHYLYTKADWSFYVAHMANVITLSTTLVWRCLWLDVHLEDAAVGAMSKQVK